MILLQFALLYCWSLYRFDIFCRFRHLLTWSNRKKFIDYQLLRDEDIPAQVWQEASTEPNEDGENHHYRMDTLWHYLSTLKSGDGYQRFQKLCKIAKLVLVIPHSNADEERVFPMIRKNKTPFRPSLGLDKTLPSLTVKLATEEPCHQFQPTSSVVERAGKVTWEYNKEHRKSV